MLSYGYAVHVWWECGIGLQVGHVVRGSPKNLVGWLVHSAVGYTCRPTSIYLARVINGPISNT